MHLYFILMFIGPNSFSISLVFSVGTVVFNLPPTRPASLQPPVLKTNDYRLFLERFPWHLFSILQYKNQKEQSLPQGEPDLLYTLLGVF